MNSARSRARRCVVQALYQWQLTGHDVGALDPQYFISEGDGAIDRPYLESLLREVLDHIDELDEILEPLLDRPIREVDPVERAVLRLGACELRFHPEIPFRVIINEAVELAKLYGAEQGHKYVNGILDKLAAQLRGEEVAALGRDES